MIYGRISFEEWDKLNSYEKTLFEIDVLKDIISLKDKMIYLMSNMGSLMGKKKSLMNNMGSLKDKKIYLFCKENFLMDKESSLMDNMIYLLGKNCFLRNNMFSQKANMISKIDEEISMKKFL